MRNDDLITISIHFGNPENIHYIQDNTVIEFISNYREIFKQLGFDADFYVGPLEINGTKINMLLGTLSVIGFIGVDNIYHIMTGERFDDAIDNYRHKLIKTVNDFITKKPSELPKNLPNECIKPKNKIYKALINDKCVTSFNFGGHIPIINTSFPQYIHQENEERSIYIGKREINVFSPDWKNKRSWRGQIIGEWEYPKNFSFNFDTELTGKFWEKVRTDEIILHTGTDKMLVQLIHNKLEKVKLRAIRVITYNDFEIDRELTISQIEKILSIEIINSINNDQPSLF